MCMHFANIRMYACILLALGLIKLHGFIRTTTYTNQRACLIGCMYANEISIKLSYDFISMLSLSVVQLTMSKASKSASNMNTVISRIVVLFIVSEPTDCNASMLTSGSIISKPRPDAAIELLTRCDMKHMIAIENIVIKGLVIKIAASH